MVDGELVGYRQTGDKLYELRDSEVARKRAEIGMVFQRFNLFPHMTALGNLIEAPILVKGVRKARRPKRAASCSQRVGLEDKVDEYPAGSRAASSSASRSRGRWRWTRS